MNRRPDYEKWCKSHGVGGILLEPACFMKKLFELKSGKGSKADYT